MSITIPGTSATAAPVYRYWKSGSEEYREGIRSGVLYTDRLKSGGSWSQAINVGWEIVRDVQ